MQFEAHDVATTAGGTTSIPGDAEAIRDDVALMRPPGPLQERLKDCGAVVSEVTWMLPDVGFAPVQAPDAVHAVASVEDHVTRAGCPMTIMDGATEIDRIGAAAVGGGFPELVLPPPPPQATNRTMLAIVNAMEASSDRLRIGWILITWLRTRSARHSQESTRTGGTCSALESREVASSLM